MAPDPTPVDLPSQTPLYHADETLRYDRQSLIRDYEAEHHVRLIVMVDSIFPAVVTFFEDLIYDADPDQDLHLMLASPGGDGETAIRLVRSAQARCRKLVVVVPDQAKSAATLLAMGAHHIMMGPTSDLGPVDPQFMLPSGSLVSAKDIIASIERATQAVQDAPDTFPIWASLLSDVSGLMVEQARAALDRTDELVREALASCPDRKQDDVAAIAERVNAPLVKGALSHGAVFGAQEAKDAGLPVLTPDASSRQWQMLWRLWAKCYSLGPVKLYEGARASQLIPMPHPQL